MTFIVGWGQADLGFLAADSRMKFPGLGGLIIDGSHSKLHRLSGGWAAGTGVHQWITLAVDRMRTLQANDVEGLGREIRAVRESRQLEELLERLRGAKEALRERHGEIGDISVLHRTSQGLAMAAFSDQGHCPAGAVSQRLLMNTLREVPWEDLTALAGQMLAILHERERTPAAVVRGVAGLFHGAFGRCGPTGSMSDSLEVAIMIDRGTGLEEFYLPLTPCLDVLSGEIRPGQVEG